MYVISLNGLSKLLYMSLVNVFLSKTKIKKIMGTKTKKSF